MGAEQSKQSEESGEKVIYSDSGNVNFSSDLLAQLSDAVQHPTPSPARQHTLDAHIRDRIATELQRLQAEEAAVREEIERVLEKENLDKEKEGAESGRELDSKALESEMGELKRKIEKFEAGKTMRGEGREEVQGKQEAVVRCYKENAGRPLDCWQEVEDFKQSVLKLEQKYIESFR